MHVRMSLKWSKRLVAETIHGWNGPVTLSVMFGLAGIFSTVARRESNLGFVQKGKSSRRLAHGCFSGVQPFAYSTLLTVRAFGGLIP